MKFHWQAVLWLIGGLLIGGILYLMISPPRGKAIQLLPAPTPAPIQVHVVGAVANPGLYYLPIQSRVKDAIDAAGGLQTNANAYALNLAAQLQDGEQIVIPTQIPTPNPTEIQLNPQTKSNPEQIDPFPTENPGSDGLININTASQEELETLPGIGPVTAEKIILYRQTNGPFTTIAAILEVSGIGPVKFAGIKDLITVSTLP
jgi:competence protein ComEA